MPETVGFMFAGQGAQSVGMGRDLYESSPAAKAVFDEADSVLGRSITQLCFHGPPDKLTESAQCQPAIYTVSVACMRALQEQVEIRPIVTGGLSLGEFAALTAAEALSFRDGITLVAKRGSLMDEACRAADGAMAAVIGNDLELIRNKAAENDVDVANYNCPGQTVISGRTDNIDKAVAALEAAGVRRVVKLDVAGAYHSRLMADAAEEFGSVLASATIGTPACPVVQNVVGKTVTDPGMIRENLQKQVSGSVRWEECVHAMMGAGAASLVEIGPGTVLSGFMRRIDRTVPVCHVSGAEDLDAAVKALQA